MPLVVSVALIYVDRRNLAVTTGLAHSLEVPFALRLLLGISESIAYPAYSKIIVANFPEQRRGLANGLIDVGCRFGRAKIRATAVRKAFAVGGLAGSAALLTQAAAVDDQAPAMSLLALAGFVYGLFSSHIWTITQTLAGATAAAKWTGIQNGAGNLAGIAAPVVTGFIVERISTSLSSGFDALLRAGALCYLLVVLKIEPVSWEKQGDLRNAPERRDPRAKFALEALFDLRARLRPISCDIK